MPLSDAGRIRNSMVELACYTGGCSLRNGDFVSKFWGPVQDGTGNASRVMCSDCGVMTQVAKHYPAAKKISQMIDNQMIDKRMVVSQGCTCSLSLSLSPCQRVARSRHCGCPRIERPEVIGRLKRLIDFSSVGKGSFKQELHARQANPWPSKHGGRV